ncbi:MAG: H-type small acid-soluble spore protein [Tepidibacter sp.]|jgi:H-type small acid-soluble spore protein|uniref:H-type small acid-soluble spore protein n=1 Tax=Tepidibacter sp. TaxID=2529387 RepID=UPI0025FB6421|nr:H-type small acid-soluble spore protein [Tepidibacter sp.]MCT4508611.1 H-type small acid-soluble spore protein [Tepidibacter sp.]
MLLRRATEILQSNGNVEVLYNNEPVWLENIDSRTETVYVKSLSKDKRMVVPIDELVENEHIGRH